MLVLLFQARADRLQDQIDAQTLRGKRKGRPTLTFADSSSTQTMALQSMPSLPTILSLSCTQNTHGDSQAGEQSSLTFSSSIKSRGV